MENLVKIKSAVETLELELEKFNKGNQAAGTRARAAAQEIKSLAQEIRVEISLVKASKSK